ncbi:activated Cdc42 kinase-like [Arctopsyche grandis]|uniref:activated Cdc42 kinase-like n=1 Tax=Arctopsyche grandis TaxID=121162 RepID=UPI00406DA2A2
MENGIGLFEFLNEAELQQYYDSFKSDLKIQKTSQLKYVTDEDLNQLGMSRPEQRRLKKFYAKYYSQNYLSKIKRLLGPTKRDDLSTSSLSSEDKSPDAKTNSTSDTLNKVANKHIIPAENITVNKELGTGEFGVVQQGVWTNGAHGIQVAIKCLYREQMHTNAMEFLKEAAIMHGIEHKSIVRLYGVVLHPDSLMLVTELAPLRSLLECLKEVALRTSFPVLTLCDFALQICEGMAYLENKRLIHRDLAARNILVFTKNKVKVSDFGLSRALGAGKDYYQTNFNVNLKLPIAWCAPECISYLKFTSSSDVWAFAVTLWEMFSYGFQPWAAFSGHQILVAIDTPNCQRLEPPECCPKEYYALMMKCWNHEPTKRPKFSELVSILPDCKPEQVQAAASSNFDASNKKSDQLHYRIGDVITVLDKSTSVTQWKGSLNNGSTGLFNPLNTVSYLGASLPSAGTKTSYSPSNELIGSGLRSSLIRNDKERSTITRRKLRSDMISAPQGEVKHTGHIGLDGAYFGDVSFLEYNKLPRQVVTPYKPSEDLEQTPLINPNSPSHLTGNNSILLRETIKPNTINVTDIPTADVEDIREYGNIDDRNNGHNFTFETFPLQKRIFKWGKKKDGRNADEPFLSNSKASSQSLDVCKSNEVVDDESDVQLHNYQEISDDEDQRASDFGQSLLDEMEMMFRSYGESKSTSNNQDFINTNHRNELTELNSKLAHSSLTSKKKQTVKPISAHDSRTLDSAIALANKITVKSMTDLEQEEPPRTPTSPAERSKFSFRFPLGGHSSGSHSRNGTIKESDVKMEKRNFSQEAQSVPDIQTSLTEESKLAYKSLIEQPCQLETTLMKIKNKHIEAMQNSHSHFEMETFGKHHHCSDKLISIDTPDTASPIRNTVKNVNPLPLPPKDPSKHTDVGKRHTRKHPLILHAPAPSHDVFTFEVNTSKIVTPNVEDKISERNIFAANQYENVTNNFPTTSLNPFDTPSLNFEAQIETDFNSADCCDGLTNNFDFEGCSKSNVDNSLDVPFGGKHNLMKTGNREGFALSLNDNVELDFIDESPNSSLRPFIAFEAKPSPFTQDTKPLQYPELCLFPTTKDDLKVGDPLETNNLMKNSPDRVSVEDLLEFADQKPCGRQRGTDSDEVRIMCKVLNQQVSPEACLSALDFASWNVHRAIKLAKLKLMGLDSPTLYECSVALDGCEWDVARAAAMLADSVDIAQV